MALDHWRTSCRLHARKDDVIIMKSTAFLAYAIAGLSLVAITVTDIVTGSIPDVLSVLAISAVSGALGITIPSSTTATVTNDQTPPANG